MTKKSFAPDFDHLDLRNAMIPLMTPSALLEANTSGNGITWPRWSCLPYFNHPDLRNWCYALAIKWHWCWYQWHHMTKKRLCCISFWLFWHIECNVAISNAISIMCFDTDASVFTWPNMSCCTSFSLSRHKVWNGTTADVISIMCTNVGASGFT